LLSCHFANAFLSYPLFHISLPFHLFDHEPTSNHPPNRQCNSSSSKITGNQSALKCAPAGFHCSLCPSLILFELRPTGMHLSSIIAIIIVLLLRRSVIFAKSKNLFLIKLISHQTCIKFYTWTNVLLHVKQYISKISVLHINNNKISDIMLKWRFF